MFEKVSRSLKYDSNIFFIHKHIYIYIWIPQPINLPHSRCACGVIMQCKLCDFVIWSQNELVILRSDLDKEFVCEAIGKATTFCKYRVPPELVGKYYTRESSEYSIHTL